MRERLGVEDRVRDAVLTSGAAAPGLREGRSEAGQDCESAGNQTGGSSDTMKGVYEKRSDCLRVSVRTIVRTVARAQSDDGVE